MKYAESTYTRISTHLQEAQANHAEFLYLYDSYFPRVYNYIRYRSGDADTADDLTATVFEKALYNFHRYQPDRGPFCAWLFAIARNIVNSHLRHQIRHRTTSFESIPDQPVEDGLPEASFISSETSSELITALDTLNERERDLLSLKFAAHLTNRRIAVISGLTEANVGVIIYRSLKKLRKEMVSGE